MAFFLTLSLVVGVVGSIVLFVGGTWYKSKEDKVAYSVGWFAGAFTMASALFLIYLSMPT